MNSEDKIYNKIKSASQKGEKDFPGMDKVWNRVEEKLDNTIVVKKKNSWQKLAIAATVLLSFSIIYQFVSNNEIIKDKNINTTTENPIIVSNDSVKKIIDKAKEVVVENDNSIKKEKEITSALKFNSNTIEENPWATSFAPTAGVLMDSAVKIRYDFNPLSLEEKRLITTELNKNLSNENEVSFRNSAFNSSSSTNGYFAQSKKYEAPAKEVKSNYKAKSAKSKVAVAEQQSDDIVVIDGVMKDKKELDKISTEDVDEVTHLKKPLYIINGIEYSEESLFGKNPTSPYAPLDKQKVTSTNILKPADATKIYGKKGENGIVIITTKDGKPADK